MSDIEKILGKDVLQQISSSVGNVNEKEVEDVLESILPQLLSNCDSGEMAQRAAALQQDPQRGFGSADLLSLLLGGNSGSVTAQVAQSTGVSTKKTGSILKIAAPLLLLYLLKKKNTPAQQQSHQGGGLLGALMGGGQAQQPVQPISAQQQAGGGLLDMLLGGQTQQAQQQPGGGLLDMLLGGQTQQAQQPVQPLQPLQAFQTQQQPTQAGGDLLSSLLGGNSGGSGDLLSGIFSLLGDTGRSIPQDDDK